MGWLKAVLAVIKYAPAIVEAVKIVIGRHPELVPKSAQASAQKLVAK